MSVAESAIEQCRALLKNAKPGPLTLLRRHGVGLSERRREIVEQVRRWNASRPVRVFKDL